MASHTHARPTDAETSYFEEILDLIQELNIDPMIHTRKQRHEKAVETYNEIARKIGLIMRKMGFIDPLFPKNYEERQRNDELESAILRIQHKFRQKFPKVFTYCKENNIYIRPIPSGWNNFGTGAIEDLLLPIEKKCIAGINDIFKDIEPFIPTRISQKNTDEDIFFNWTVLDGFDSYIDIEDGSDGDFPVGPRIHEDDIAYTLKISSGPNQDDNNWRNLIISDEAWLSILREKLDFLEKAYDIVLERYMLEMRAAKPKYPNRVGVHPRHKFTRGIADANGPWAWHFPPTFWDAWNTEYQMQQRGPLAISAAVPIVFYQ